MTNDIPDVVLVLPVGATPRPPVDLSKEVRSAVEERVHAVLLPVVIRAEEKPELLDLRTVDELVVVEIAKDLIELEAVLTSALLDRLLHHAETIVVQGNSYRMKDQIES